MRAGGRSGADQKCVADQPEWLSCSALRTLLSVNGTDQIFNMPARYGFDSAKRMFFWHRRDGLLWRFANDWADALDGSIEVSAYAGTGVPGEYWTGDNGSGLVDPVDGNWEYQCNDWTFEQDSGVAYYMGTSGNRSSTTAWLFQSGKLQCTYSTYLLCACKYNP